MIKSIFYKMLEDPENRARLDSLKDWEDENCEFEVYQLFCENGYGKDFESFRVELRAFLNSDEIVKIFESDGNELPEEALEGVAGGFGVKGAVITGLTSLILACTGAAALNPGVFNLGKANDVSVSSQVKDDNGGSGSKFGDWDRNSDEKQKDSEKGQKGDRAKDLNRSDGKKSDLKNKKSKHGDFESKAKERIFGKAQKKRGPRGGGSAGIHKLDDSARQDRLMESRVFESFRNTGEMAKSRAGLKKNAGNRQNTQYVYSITPTANVNEKSTVPPPPPPPPPVPSIPTQTTSSSDTAGSPMSQQDQLAAMMKKGALKSVKMNTNKGPEEKKNQMHEEILAMRGNWKKWENWPKRERVETFRDKMGREIAEAFQKREAKFNKKNAQNVNNEANVDINNQELKKDVVANAEAPKKLTLKQIKENFNDVEGNDSLNHSMMNLNHKDYQLQADMDSMDLSNEGSQPILNEHSSLKFDSSSDLSQKDDSGSEDSILSLGLGKEDMDQRRAKLVENKVKDLNGNGANYLNWSADDIGRNDVDSEEPSFDSKESFVGNRSMFDMHNKAKGGNPFDLNFSVIHEADESGNDGSNEGSQSILNEHSSLKFDSSSDLSQKDDSGSEDSILSLGLGKENMDQRHAKLVENKVKDLNGNGANYLNWSADDIGRNDVDSEEPSFDSKESFVGNRSMFDMHNKAKGGNPFDLNLSAIDKSGENEGFDVDDDVLNLTFAGLGDEKGNNVQNVNDEAKGENFNENDDSFNFTFAGEEKEDKEQNNNNQNVQANVNNNVVAVENMDGAIPPPPPPPPAPVYNAADAAKASDVSHKANVAKDGAQQKSMAELIEEKKLELDKKRAEKGNNVNEKKVENEKKEGEQDKNFLQNALSKALQNRRQNLHLHDADNEDDDSDDDDWD